MIIGNSGNGNLVDSAGTGGTSSVSIANSPHMFTVLSSGLYSDKIAAVLREIGCNAMDAHIMSGQADRPIEVKLPTPLDRTFYVKDWGPGLDDFEFRELYTTYGWSNKQKRNDATGAFGLGSKSPFAYTTQNAENSDGYTVETAKNGSRRIYTCYIGDSGTPQVTLLHEGPVDENWQHGVKVTFPVQSNDIDEFHTKAHAVYRWFAVPPVILGIDRPLAPPEYSLKGEHYGLLKVADPSAVGVVMGGVRYPLRAERLKGLSSAEASLLPYIALFLPMGCVKMTPSREELEYTESTRAEIQKYLKDSAKEIANGIYQVVSAPEASRWLWRRKVAAYYAALPAALQGSSFKHLLASTEMSAADVSEVTGLVDNGGAPLPSWFGEGRGRFTSPVAGPGPSNRPHCRAYMYGAVVGHAGTRAEIVEGHFPSRSDSRAPSKAALSYSRAVEVYWADAPGSELRIQRRSEEFSGQIVLVVPGKGVPRERCEEYANLLLDLEDFRGLTLQKSSELGDDLAEKKEREAARARARALQSLSVRQRMAATEVVVWDPVTGALDTARLGDIDESGGLYYAISNRSPEAWSLVLSEKGDTDADTRSIRVHSSKQPIRTMLEVNGPIPRQVVLLKGMGALNRLKLTEQGFVHLFDRLRQAANSEGMADLLALRPHEPWKERYSGLAVLLTHLYQNPPCKDSETLLSLPGLKPLTDFLAAEIKLRRQFTSLEQERLSSLKGLVGHLYPSSHELVIKCRAAGADTTKDSLFKQFPNLALFDEEAVRQRYREDPSGTARAVLGAHLGASAPTIKASSDNSALAEVRAQAVPGQFFHQQELHPLVAALVQSSEIV